MGEVGLAAYTDRLSGRPGDAIRFHVSSSSSSTDQYESKVAAKLTRCICADPNPEGPGCIEEDASEWFEPRQFAARHQPIRRGSYAKTKNVIDVPDTARWASIEIWMFPTYIIPNEEDEDTAAQCIWSWGELGLYLKPGGVITLSFKGTDYLSSVSESYPSRVLSNRWYHVTATVWRDSRKVLNYELIIMQQHKLSKKESLVSSVRGDNESLDIDSMTPVDAHFELATGGTFNGRLEDPEIMIKDTVQGWTNHLLFFWDTSQNMTEWSIPSNDDSSIQRNSNPLLLYNNPTRAVRGRLWDGSEFNWKHKPSHYGGIHFHDDDVYDFGWECDMKWTIPQNIPSGIYIMRLVNEQGEDESLPLFICPPMNVGEKRKKICILISTFTYVMYGNHARSDFKPSWLDRIREWNAYPHSPSQYSNYGCSTYNFHKDESGICFASHLRPLFNLRPRYLTFGDSNCSGLRHFPADTHLIAWMHHHKIECDIVTDHELHKEGVAAIAGYQTLMTGTHPEYHTLESLNALQEFRDDHGGNLIYLGGNGFYWRVAAKDEDASILEIRRAEDGVRTWASEPGEYHHMVDGGNYGGLWRRNDRPPQQLVGLGFTAQGSFEGMPYKRVSFDPEMTWVFTGIESEELLGNFGYSGNGAAGFELDRVDQRLDGGDHTIFILAQSFDESNSFMLVPEEVLTTYSNLSGVSGDQARRSDMIYFRTSSGAQVFSVGSITFCGSLPWNQFDNNISTLLKNVVQKFTSEEQAGLASTREQLPKWVS